MSSKAPSKDVLHVIIGGSPWRTADIRYRRHRLAEYLSKQPNTASVYWLYPQPYARWPSRVEAHGHPGAISIEPESSGLREFGIPTKRASMQYARILHRALLKEVTQHIVCCAGCRKVLWFTIPMYSGILDVWPWSKIVYDCSDHWSAVRRGRALKGNLVNLLRSRSEARIVRRSSVLLSSSSYLARRLNRKFGRNAIIVENGVDARSFRDAQPASDIQAKLPPSPRLVFVGPLKDTRIDIELLHAVATSTPNCNLILVGPAADGLRPGLRRLLGLPNVTWLGVKRPEAIPGIMKLMDIGLIPYRSTAFNAGAFPLKFMEYLAAGLPVVGCGAPAIEQYAQDGVYIGTDGTPATFIAACRKALTWTNSTHRRVGIAQANDWGTKLAFMHDTVITNLMT